MRSVALFVLLGICFSHAALARDAQRFDMPSQDLATSLNQFAVAVDWQIVFAPQLVKDMRAPKLEGNFTREEAIQKLLEGSGLQYRFIAARTVAVSAQQEKEVSKTTQLESVPDAGRHLALEDAAAPDGQAASADAGAIFGHVSDASSGGNLAGALVRVLETGQTTSTDELGTFRLRGLEPGEYSLSISYLGYTEKLWRVSAVAKGATRLDFPLETSAWDLAEITVFGNRSARAIALNQQRTADNNAEIVSADSLGHFTGTTISEALRHVAGITFQRNPTTGAGTNIMIRGLEPDMNAVKLNGLNLPVGNGNSRSPALDNILADSVSKITISKTLLASQDSAGTGGLVEIETKSPLERPARYVNMAVEGGRRGADFGDNFLLSGTVSGIFGNERNFGLSVSGQYLEATTLSTSYQRNLRFGQYLPLSPAGTPTIGEYDLDPRLLFPSEPGNDGVYMDGDSSDLRHSENTTFAVTLSAEWQPTPATSLKLDVQRSRSIDSNFSASGGIGLSSSYLPRPVAALNGEVRQALTYNGVASVSQTYNVADGLTNTTDTYSLRGSSSPGKWQINYTAGFAHARMRDPHEYYLGLGYEAGPETFLGVIMGPDAFLPEAVDPVEGIIIAPYPKVTGKRLIPPLLTQATWDFFNEADHYFLNVANQNESWGGNDRKTADINTRYSLGWRAVEYLEAGVNFELASYFSRAQSLLAQPAVVYVPMPDYPFEYPIYPSLAPLGLQFKPTDLSRVGNPGQGFHYLDERDVRDFFENLDAYLQNPAVFSGTSFQGPTDLEKQRRTEERSLAAYLQGKLHFGRLEIIPGLRLSRVQVNAVNVSAPRIFNQFGVEDTDFARANARLLNESVVQTDLLPRVNVNFRQTDNLVFRGGYFLTTARPQLLQLSNSQEIQLLQFLANSPNGDRQTLYVGKGNPALKPALTHNLDADVEYYHDAIGVIRLGAFYKQIKHSLQANDYRNFQDIASIDLPDDPRFDGITPQNTFVVVTIPENSDEDVSIWGAEVHIERQFTSLPGALNGLGMYANYGYTDSKAVQHWPWYAPVFDAGGNIVNYELHTLKFAGQRFNYQAAHSGTVALTYNKRGIDGTLGYSFQDRYQTAFTPSNLDDFTEGLGTLDLRLAYFFNRGGMKWRAFLEGTDLLKGTKDPDLLTSRGGVGGAGRYYNSGSYLGGREIRIGFSATL